MLICKDVDVPLLHSKRLTFGDTQPNHLTLGIKCIEINVSDDTEGIGWVVACKLG